MAEIPQKVTTTQETQEQAKQAKWYNWTFRANSTAPEQKFEFGMPLLPQDAANRICSFLGIDQIPEGASVYHTELSTVSPSQAPQPPQPEQEPEVLYEADVLEDVKPSSWIPPNPLPPNLVRDRETITAADVGEMPLDFDATSASDETGETGETGQTLPASNPKAK